MSLPKNCPTCGSDDPKRWDHANSIDPGGCANPWHEAWHVITERADGPNLDDIVRLIRYLREHDFAVRFDYSRMRPTLSVTWELYEGGTTLRRRYTVTESDTVGPGRFVGPDGTVYDNERNPL